MAGRWHLLAVAAGSLAGLIGSVPQSHASGPPKGEGGGSGGGSGGQETVPTSKVKAKLLAERPVLIPGKTATLALHFTIQPGWHIYSNAISDSGSPPSPEWTLPPGFKVLPTRYPAPMRHKLPGDLLDHVYEREVMLLVPVSVPADAKPGTTVKLAAELTWMVCKDLCLIEKQPVSIELPVASQDSEQVVPDAKFLAAHRRIPVPVTLGKGTDGEKAGITASWVGGAGPALKLQVKDAKALTFYPIADSAVPVNILADGASNNDTLTIRFEPATAGDAKSAPVHGVLEIKRSGGGAPETGVDFYELSIPCPPAR